ncbi:MAG: hypothetical protein AB1Z98_27980 [Nannocystaceae bacterium]
MQSRAPVEHIIESEHDFATVELWRGAEHEPDAPPCLLVEVPHGADRRSHYEAMRARLEGPFPEDLHEFFHVNTDEGAYDYGRCVAEAVVARDPRRAARVIRCSIPRTFIDANRLEDTKGGNLGEGGMTAGLHSYVRDPSDRALLLSLHRAYVALCERAYAQTCGTGGFGLMPHTYGPIAIGGFDQIDEHIVHNLRRAHAPGTIEGWPERPHVDLITRTKEGERMASAAMVAGLLQAYGALGLRAIEGESYYLHPASLGCRWALRYPRQTLGLELRRDLLGRWVWNEESELDPEAIAKMAAPLADAIDTWLREHDR